ncbi:hypothetical protein NEDG_01174 [Nematocida displodere]|uniref:Uncharacterized protein n=1 Tax=Nematocida displodere TaxID=1805483 RepID=A0A177EAT1_9MICR|nr:hypothetical protein NEDG_01174 [Nematocida displodere]
MDECKELFRALLAAPSEFSVAIDQLREKLCLKEKEIKESTLGITPEEASEMIGVLERKLTCLINWEKLFPATSQS